MLGADRSRAMVDQNGNGMSDVWEWVYNAVGISPNADADGDGFSNLQEALAGTNPFDSNSYPKISVTTYSNASFSVGIPSAPGKVYQLQSVQFLGSTNWVNETNLEATSGNTLTLAVPAEVNTKYFRIAISDTNTDGSSLNDWEKYQLGLDPSNPYSNGQQDANGHAISDYAYVTNMLASQNVITIAATDVAATQPDPGQKTTATGVFTVTRGGFPLDTITVNLGSGGPGIAVATAGLDYSNLPASVSLPAGISSATVTLVPMADTNLQTPVIAQLNLLPGANYTVGSPSNASVVIYPSPTASGTGLLGQYYTNSSTTYTNSKNFNPTNLFLTRIDPVIDFNWSNGMSPNLSNGLYTVRWTGQVQPQFSETYFFDVNSDDGCRLWVNDQLLIDKWQAQGATDWTNSIALQAGARYDLRLEYLQAGGAAQAHLYWYSPSQSKTIIPNNCLFVSDEQHRQRRFQRAIGRDERVERGGVPWPAVQFHRDGREHAARFHGQRPAAGTGFQQPMASSAGVPTLGRQFSSHADRSNLVGRGRLGREHPGFEHRQLGRSGNLDECSRHQCHRHPHRHPANITNVLGTLEGVLNYGDNYGERVRGYFTAPVTGNYYFWIAGSDSAQLWISDDNNQVNQVLRAWVTPTNNPTAPGQNGTSSRQWNLQSSQQSGWLSLSAGQQYYIEILHKAGVGTNDNWSVGWLQDPTGTNNTPAGVVPGYLLSRYYPPLPANNPGTLYSANLLALPGVVSEGVGSATLRVNAAGTQATLNFTDHQPGGNAHRPVHQFRSLFE
jgi:hypothetical protein